MEKQYNYKKFAVLYVDDEVKSLKYFELAYGETFRILTASCAADAFKIIQDAPDEIGILMTDQRMPGMTGVQLLEQVRNQHPRIIRILCTAYSDLDAAIASVNSGSIYKYITKPWDIPQLDVTLKRALEFHMVQRERDELLREKLTTLHNLMIADRVVSLGIIASGLNHQIHNALDAMKTFIDLAPGGLGVVGSPIERMRSPHFWKEFYSYNREQAVRISQILAELPTGAEHLEPGGWSMAELVGTKLQNFQPLLQEKSLRTSIHTDPDDLRCELDRSSCERLLEIYLKAQMLCLPEGGELAFSCHRTEGTEGRLVLELVDNGHAVSRDLLRNIFDPMAGNQAPSREFGIYWMALHFLAYHLGGTVETTWPQAQGMRVLITLPVRQQKPHTSYDDASFLQKVLLNENLWDRLTNAASSHQS